MFGTLTYAELFTNATAITAEYAIPVLLLASLFAAKRLLRIVKSFLG